MRAAARSRRRTVGITASAVFAAGLLSVAPVPAGAATSTTTLGPGVTLSHLTFSLGGPQSVYMVTARLGAHARLTVATPQHAVGAKAVTTLAMARGEHAIAGLNGDTFYFDTSPRGKAYNPTLGPHGGVVRNGVTLKAPLDDQNANFAVTADGHAYIGQVGFSATVRADTGGTRKIASINSIETAWNSNIMLADPNLLSHTMSGRTCTSVLLRATTTAGRFAVVGAPKQITSYTRVGRGYRALVTCPGKNDNATYFRQNLHPGRSVTVTIGYARKNIRTLISGTSMLVHAGRVYTDTKAHRAVNEYGDKQKPETFICVNRDRTTVSFGVFEGARSGATGVTYAQESRWLVSRHCYEAMAVDGSTSTQLVAQRPHSTLTLLNRATAPYAGGQRPQVDGLFLLTS